LIPPARATFLAVMLASAILRGVAPDGWRWRTPAALPPLPLAAGDAQRVSRRQELAALLATGGAR
jgi:hypothetical protein